MKKLNFSRGFTLVEIAIVLVIIGLLLGGVLKGQELINNAKVRSIADRQNSLKVAWFSFVDRFASLPGDYAQANVYITGGVNGDGDGTLTTGESVLAFQHMTGAGYLRCPHCTATDSTLDPTSLNSITNTYGGVMSIWHDETYYAVRGSTATARLMVHTGPRIPSNIIAEVDRKIDDGVPNTGDTNYNDYDPTNSTDNTVVDGTEQCMKIDAAGGTNGVLNTITVQFWRPANSQPPVFQNCGASVFI